MLVMMLRCESGCLVLCNRRPPRFPACLPLACDAGTKSKDSGAAVTLRRTPRSYCTQISLVTSQQNNHNKKPLTKIWEPLYLGDFYITA